MSRPNMRFAAIKTVNQQNTQAAHRIREVLFHQRAAKVKQIRGLAGKYGLVAPVGIGQLRTALPRWLEGAENGLSDAFRVLLAGLAEDLHHLDERVATVTASIEQQVQTDPVAKRLMTLQGVGPLTANAWREPGRDFAASLDLTPRQHSTDERTHLLDISKRADSYLRKLLVHGARAVLRHAEGKAGRLRQTSRVPGAPRRLSAGPTGRSRAMQQLAKHQGDARAYGFQHQPGPLR